MPQPRTAPGAGAVPSRFDPYLASHELVPCGAAGPGVLLAGAALGDADAGDARVDEDRALSE
jgi:hypothetical protein